MTCPHGNTLRRKCGICDREDDMISYEDLERKYGEANAEIARLRAERDAERVEREAMNRECVRLRRKRKQTADDFHLLRSMVRNIGAERDEMSRLADSIADKLIDARPRLTAAESRVKMLEGLLRDAKPMILNQRYTEADIANNKERDMLARIDDALEPVSNPDELPTPPRSPDFTVYSDDSGAAYLNMTNCPVHGDEIRAEARDGCLHIFCPTCAATPSEPCSTCGGTGYDQSKFPAHVDCPACTPAPAGNNPLPVSDDFSSADRALDGAHTWTEAEKEEITVATAESEVNDA